jgi:hypothetical protein
MENEGTASRIAGAIVDYIYEEGSDKISIAEALGILEFAKLQIVEDLKDTK